MKRRISILTGALIVGLTIGIFKAKAIGDDGKAIALMTQCNDNDPNQCGPVAYSNDCITGSGTCKDRTCPSGSSEGNIYP